MSIHNPATFEITVDADLGPVRWDNFKYGDTCCFLCGEKIVTEKMLMWHGTGPGANENDDTSWLYLHYDCVPRFCEVLTTDWDTNEVRE